MTKKAIASAAISCAMSIECTPTVLDGLRLGCKPVYTRRQSMASPSEFARLQTYVPRAKADELRELAARDGQKVAPYLRAIVYRHLRDAKASIPPIGTSVST